MRRISFWAVAALLAFLCCGIPSHSLAQSKSPLAFDNAEWSFGTILEADGPVSHIFTFTNTSRTPIIIERVYSECGCTTPKYSSKPVRPGRQGSIEVVFDPDNYRGQFNKKVSIISGNGQYRNEITVSGTVVARERRLEEIYPYRIAGGVRANDMRLAFEYIENGAANSRVIELVNTSDRSAAIKVASVEGSGYLEVHAPASLEPGGKGSVTMTYDLSGSVTPVYGMISDRIYLSVDGIISDMAISAYAIAIDDFSDIDPLRIAGCYIDPVFHNFGKLSPGSIMSKEITLSNTGNGPLIIRDASPRSNTTCSLTAGTQIMPGKTIKFTITVTAPETEGIKTAGVTLITNDPERPMREVRAAVDVIK